MSGRGREATLPAWMAPNAQPPGAPPAAAGPRPTGAPAPFAPGAGGPPPSGAGWPPPGAPPGQGPPPGQPGPPPGMGGPPPSGFPGAPPGHPPFAGQPPPFGGPPGSHPPPAGALPPGGLPFPPPGSAPGQGPPQGGPPGGPQGPGGPPMGMPPMGAFPPGNGPPPGMPPMMPPPMWLPPGARPPPMHGGPMPYPGMPPPGMLPPGASPAPMGAPFPGMPPGPQPGQPPHQPQGQPAPPSQQGQAGGSAGAPAGSASQPAKSAWTEHTAPDGRKYYYNGQTKQSSWEKPAELLTQQEKTEQVPWKEYTAPDGRKYYYNRETKESKWTMPEEMKRALAKSGGGSGTASTPPPDAGKAEAVDSGRGTTPELTPRGTPEPADTKGADTKYQYATKAEAKDAFKQLLSSMGCTSETSWEQALKLIVNDPRYGALKSLGEKKACFNEYVQQRRNFEKEEERKRLKQAREDFIQMVVKHPDLKLSYGFRKAKEVLEEEAAWKALPEREREELFSEAFKERDRREKEERRQEKLRKCAAFRAVLDDSGIQLGTEWRKACAKLEEHDAFEDLDKVDRLEVYQEFQKDLERRDREDKEREREARRREDRRARDAFRALLTEHRARGLINVKTRWWEYSRHVIAEDAYLAVEKCSAGSRPKELFEYLIEDLEKEYEGVKALMKDLLRRSDFTVTPSTTFEDFNAQLIQAEASTRPSDTRDEGQIPDKEEEEAHANWESKLEKIDSETRLLYFDELVGRAKQREAEEAERKRRAQDKFASLLRHLRKLDADTTWDQFLDDYDREPEYRALGADDARPIFDEYVAKLKQRRDKRRRGSDDESDGSRERTRRRSHRDDDSDDEGHKKHKKKSSRRHDDSDDEDRKSRKKKHKDKKSKDRDREESSQRGGDAEAEDGAAGNGDVGSAPVAGDKAD